jgi:LPXTG-motif cell wall-anchored protein
MVNWNPLTGLVTDNPGTFAYEWNQKFGGNEWIGYILLGVVLVGCLILFWRKKTKE